MASRCFFDHTITLKEKGNQDHGKVKRMRIYSEKLKLINFCVMRFLHLWTKTISFHDDFKGCAFRIRIGHYFQSCTPILIPQRVGGVCNFFAQSPFLRAFRILFNDNGLWEDRKMVVSEPVCIFPPRIFLWIGEGHVLGVREYTPLNDSSMTKSKAVTHTHGNLWFILWKVHLRTLSFSWLRTSYLDPLLTLLAFCFVQR